MSQINKSHPMKREPQPLPQGATETEVKLRQKIRDLETEVARLRKELDTVNRLNGGSKPSVSQESPTEEMDLLS